MNFGSLIQLNWKLVRERSVMCVFPLLLLLLLAERTCFSIPGVATWTNFGSRTVGGNLDKSHALIK